MNDHTSTAANTGEIALWNTVRGETWAELSDRLDKIIAPLGAEAMAALAPASGEQLIDVGCGCGQTTLELARRVGRDGAVLGVDVSAPMLRIAQGRAELAGLGHASFLNADAQIHRFEAGAADGVFSRFGVMFFADPTAAFANFGAALRPGGRLAFLCWRDVALNPMMTTPFIAALPQIPKPPPPPDPLAPGPFALADEARLRGILAAAGFEQIHISPQDRTVNSGNLDEAVDTALRVGPLGAVLRDCPHLEVVVVPAIRAALAPFVTPAGVVQDSATWIVTAHKGDARP